VVNGPGEGGEPAVWKLSREVECTLETVEVETLSDVIIMRERKRDEN